MSPSPLTPHPSPFKKEEVKMVKVDEIKSKNRKRKEAYVYGNYKFYYGYRIDRNMKEDPRLMVFRKEWFSDKDCLDIGCNQGLLTIGIAKKFFCRSMLGIDIDARLIETAIWNLQKIAKAGQRNSRIKDGIESDLSNGGFVTKHNSYSSSEGSVNFNAFPPRDWNLLERVSFQAENFVKNLDECSEKYDTILCLSVTKWVHLNWGDDGLITLFAKIWRLLRPGGIFVLEPQPWDSYKKNRRVSETARLNFVEIVFHPDLFEEILLDKIGFRSVENITDKLSGTVTGFERPIFVFRK